MPLGVARVHAEEIGGEERRLVAAGPGADLDDDVLVVVRVLRDEQGAELGEVLLAQGLQPPNFVLGQAGELRVGIRGQLFRILELLLAALQVAVDGDDLLEVGPLAAEVGQLARVGEDSRIRHLMIKFVVPAFKFRQCAEKCAHGSMFSCWVYGVRSGARADHPNDNHRRPVPISRIGGGEWLIGRTLVREVAAIQGEVVDAERLGQLGEPGLNQVGPHQAD